MDVFKLRFSARRWRILVLAVVFVPSALALYTFHRGVAYVNHVSIVFTSPSMGGATNVLLASGPSLVTTADLVGRQVQSESGRALVQASGAAASYELALAHDGNQELPAWDKPVLELSVRGTGPQQVRATVHAVEDAVRARLMSMQNAVGVAPDQFIGVDFLDAGQAGAPSVIGSPVRADLGTMVLLAGVLVLIARAWPNRPRPHQEAAVSRS